MQTYAEVMNGVVVAVGTAPDGAILQCAPPMQYILFDPGSVTVAQGYLYDGKAFSPPPALTPEQHIIKLKIFLRNYMNAVAMSHHYENITELCAMYLSQNATYKAQGAAGITFRDAVRAYVLGIYSSVQAGGTPPTLDVFLAGLPQMVWPS